MLTSKTEISHRPTTRIVSTLVVLIGLAISIASCADQPEPVEENIEPYRVLTYGLWRNDYDWPQRRDNFIAALENAQPDILCLQDVVMTAEENQVAQIADSLGYDWRFASTDTSGMGHGVAILARDSLRSTTEHVVGDSLSVAPVVTADADLGGHQISVYCTMLEPVDTDSAAGHRQVQVEALAELVDTRRRAQPSIVLGNFFAEPGAPELAAIQDVLEDPFVDVFGDDRPSTQNPFVGHRPRWTSYIFLSPRFPLNVYGGRIVLNERDDADIWMSDQFGVVLELLPEREPSRAAAVTP